MFFKSKNPEPIKEDSRIEDLKIITQMNQDLATTLDLNETLQNALEVIIKRINAQAANIFLIEEKKQYEKEYEKFTRLWYCYKCNGVTLQGKRNVLDS